MLGLVDVRGERHDAADTRRVGLAGPGGRRVHDGVLGVAQEVGGAAQAVEHARAHDAGAVGVGVDVDLDGGVHGDDAQAADDLGRVGDLLRAQQQLGRVAVPVVVEALEAVGRQADGGGGREVEVAAVEEVEERVLQHLGPDLEVLEVGAARGQAADDGVGDVADARLQRQQVRRQAAVLDLVLQELDEVARDGARVLILGRVGGRLVRVVGLDDGDDLVRVDGDVRQADAVLGVHDQVRLAVRRVVAHDDVVQALERGGGGVDLDDDLVGHLDELGGGTDGGPGDDAALLGDGGRLNDGHVQLVAGLVLGVPALQTSASLVAMESGGGGGKVLT